MMSNPLTEQRLNQLKDEATELLKDFGLLFTKNYGLATFEKIKNELEPEPSSQWKLSHRKWDDVKRTVFTGECFMKQGEGPGSFGSWKKFFIAERQDYNIDLFPDQKAYIAKKPPTATINVAGYTVVTDVSKYYHDELYKMAGPLGMSGAEVDALATFSKYSWALAHPQRVNYIFQLHKSKESGCACLGGNTVEPEDAGSEKRDEIVVFVNAMQKFTAKVTPRGQEVISIAFELACQQIGRKVASLANWTDDGTEAQMLVDMLMEALLPGLRDDILRELKGPPSMKLKLWYKTRAVIMKTLVSIASPAWAKIQSGASEVQARIEPAIKPVVGKILQIKGQIDDKIKGLAGDKLGVLIGKSVTPFLKPIIDAFEQPLKKGFEDGKRVFDETINLQDLPEDPNKMETMLDTVAREEDNVRGMLSAAAEVVEPIGALRSLGGDLFDNLNPKSYQTQAESLLLEALDAAAYTVKVRLESGIAKDEQLKLQILKDYDHDAALMRCEFVKSVARAILIPPFKKLTASVTEPVVSSVNSAIPEEMQEFLNIESLIDKFVDSFVGTTVDRAVEAAFPKPR